MRGLPLLEGVGHLLSKFVPFACGLIFGVVVPKTWLQILQEIQNFLSVVNASLFIASPV